MDDHVRREVSRYLGGIEQAARAIKWDAVTLKSCAEMLDWRPAWDTTARNSLTEAETELMEAVDLVRAVRRKYYNLPVIVDATVAQKETEKCKTDQ